MINLLGDIWFDAPASAPDAAAASPIGAQCSKSPEAKLHLYGKDEARRGRKMGHVTCVAPTLDQALAARAIRRSFEFPTTVRHERGGSFKTRRAVAERLPGGRRVANRPATFGEGGRGVTAPLDGVRVLDLSRLLPGPVCTLHLADLGADVVKVEDTGRRRLRARAGPRSDRRRTRPPDAPSAFFRMVNRNKRSLALDLKASAGRDAFLRLAQRADVIVESFRPGVVDRLGVGYAAVAALNPRIVYCSITGYGQTGPYRDRAGHDINYLGYAGVLDQTGVSGGPPALSNLQVADLLGGAMNASTGILAALFGASRTGNGTHVDIAMTDGSLAHNIFALHAIETLGHAQARGDDLLTGGVPCYGVYATQDGRHLAVGALEGKFWRALCEALDRPDLVAGQLATGRAGAAVRQQLAAIFAQQTQAHWIERLAERRVLRDAGAVARRGARRSSGPRARYGRHRRRRHPAIRAAVSTVRPRVRDRASCACARRAFGRDPARSRLQRCRKSARSRTAARFLSPVSPAECSPCSNTGACTGRADSLGQGHRRLCSLFRPLKSRS